MAWRVEHRSGDAGDFHASEPAPERSVTFHMVEHPTLVLGSAQPDHDVDQNVVAALGVQVVRRRSGGGAVLLLPGEYVWADVVIPAGDALWRDDVAQAMVWVGECWQQALATLGVASSVHRDALRSDEWSRRICWTSVGTGEVVGAGKLVGISQRRTRTFARFQTQVHRQWRPELVAALTAPPRPTAAALASAAATVKRPIADIEAAFVAALPR